MRVPCEPDWRGSREIDLELRTRQKPGEPQRTSQVVLSPRPKSHSLACSRRRGGQKRLGEDVGCKSLKRCTLRARRGAKIKKSLKAKRALIYELMMDHSEGMES